MSTATKTRRKSAPKKRKATAKLKKKTVEKVVAELGITPEQQARYEQMAETTTDEDWREYAAACKSRDEEPTTAGFLEWVSKRSRAINECFDLVSGAFFDMAESQSRKSRRALANLDSVIERIGERYELAIDRESCENVAKCGFRGDNLALAIVATDLLFRERPATLRGLMYRVVSAGWLPSTDRVHYTRIGRIMTRLREAHVVPFSWIVDGVRSTDKPSSWSGLADYAETVREAYRLSFWERLPHYVHFIVEKDAVAGTVSPVTRECDVALSPIRGYSSLSFAHEIASTWNEIDKPIFCYFMGDFDASGFDLERDMQEKLKRYCDKPLYVAGADDDTDWWRKSLKDSGGVLFQRIGVLESDFDEFDLLSLAVKDSDKRAAKFREDHGDRCAELDAIPSTELRRRVRETIESHITNREEWERLKLVEETERETLATMIGAMEGAA